MCRILTLARPATVCVICGRLCDLNETDATGTACQECADLELTSISDLDLAEMFEDYTREVPAERFPSDHQLAVMADHDLPPMGW